MANTTSYVRVIGNEVDNATDDTTYIFNPTDGLKTFTLAGGSDGDTVAISALSTDFKIKVVKNMLTLIGLKNGASAGTIVKIQMDTSNGGVEHLAFLDGKVDVTFTPSAPGSLTGQWTVGGEDIAKKYNFAKQAGNYAIDSSFTYADASYAASGVLDAERFLLTAETDDIVIQHDNTFDLVRGIIDYSGEDGEFSTFTTFDNIEGNGHTAVEIGVHDTNGSHDADLVCMSGVDQLKILDGDDSCGATLYMDASTYGSDISNLILDGNGAFTLCVEDLEVNGTLDSDNSDACSTLRVEGTVDGIDFYECIYNEGGTSEAIIGVGANGISTTVSEDSAIDISISQDEYVYSGDVVIDDLTVGDIVVDGDISAYNCVDIDNIAYACCTGDTTVGNLSIGDIDVNMATDGSSTMYFTNCAYAYCGDATAGDLDLGNVSIDIGASGCNGLYIYNSAVDGYTGNAVAGNLTIGDLSIQIGSCAESYVSAYNYACAYSECATVGDLTVGNIALSAEDHTCQCVILENEAWASYTDEIATMGNVTVGDITIDVGTDNTVCLSIYNYGSACCGTSIAGDVVIGDVSINAVSSNLAVLCGGNYLDWSTNESTVGNVTVGNVDVNMNGVYNSFCMVIENCAYGYEGTVGDTTIGDVNAYLGADAYVYVAANVYNYSHEAGNITIGNVDITIENEGTSDCGSAYFDLDFTAKSFGDVAIGDISMKGGSSAYVAATLDLSATCGSVGNLSVGDVYIGADVDGSADYCVCVCVDDDIASLNFGDITAEADGDNACVCAVICISADYGCIGDVMVGNVTLNATGDSACGLFCLDLSIDDEIGNVTVGDISVNAIGTGASGCFVNEITNCYGDIGNICYGNISLTADGKDSYIYACITAEGSCYRDIGTYTVGDIHISVSGEDASASLSMSVTCAETIGTTTVGNISIALDIAVTADHSLTTNDYAYAYYCMCSCSDDVCIGDISVSAAEVTADYCCYADVCAEVDLCAYSGDLHIGNVTVHGGYSNEGGVADNFGVLREWLDIDYCHEASIGNIDYSDYLGTANIDIDDLDGASIIKAAQDDTVIYLNDIQNSVYLGDGSDTVYVGANATTPTDATAIDVIYNFTVGDDVIEASLTNLATGGTATGYTQFLASATNSFVTGDYDVYSAKFGGNTYIAVNDGSDAVGYVVKLVGVTTTLANADVGI